MLMSDEALGDEEDLIAILMQTHNSIPILLGVSNKLTDTTRLLNIQSTRTWEKSNQLTVIKRSPFFIFIERILL